MTRLQIAIILLFFLGSCKSLTEEKFIGNSSNVVIYVDTAKEELTDCEAFRKQDTLQLSLVSNGYNVSIDKIKDSINSQLIQTWSVTDSSYIKPGFTTIYQNIWFDKPNYLRGDVLHGTIDIGFLAIHKWPSKYIDTVKVKGTVSVVVK